VLPAYSARVLLSGGTLSGFTGSALWSPTGVCPALRVSPLNSQV
jgi:hypothetical protein